MKAEEPLEELIAVSRAAGARVLAVYGEACAVERKRDGSPVTEADRRAQELICGELERLAPEIPIVAEEDGPREGIGSWDRFWLVDPLDGTKEFIERNGEFTVNIALIEDRMPKLGVVFAPALDVVYAASNGGAWCLDGGRRRRLSVREIPAEGATIVSSRSHGNAEALAEFVSQHQIAASLCAGSSLKFCLLAAGRADVYPRFGRTMEWDTAAGDAVLRAAGGSVTDLDGRALLYGKPGFENPQFIAWGSPPQGEAGSS